MTCLHVSCAVTVEALVVTRRMTAAVCDVLDCRANRQMLFQTQNLPSAVFMLRSEVPILSP